jgi:prolyl-tRNA editing enzyme YbaK/EbsC (Cys-tRNA(Pro) deacylase)
VIKHIDNIAILFNWLKLQSLMLIVLSILFEAVKGGKMSDELKSSAQKVQEALQALGLNCEVVQMQATTRTAEDAARAVGCEVGQIVKSLIFEGKQSVNEKRLGQQLSEPVKMANAEFVREMTGFAIGGVPPLGHRHPIRVFIDEDLLAYTEIWAAAGTPRAVFKLTPDQLKMITDGTVISVK